MGIPFYQTFDTYVFIISFLLIPEIFRSVFTDNNLKSLIWDPLWFPEDVSKVYSLLIKSIINEDKNGVSTIFSILKNIKLKCNITANIISILTGK